MDYNPFQPPASDIDLVDGNSFQLSESGPMRVDGQYLVVRTGVVLPWVCVKTNAPIPEMCLRKKRLTWCPPYVIAFMLLGGLVVIIAYFILRKSCKITYGLSVQMQQKYRTRLMVKSIVAIALLLAIPVSSSIDSGPSVFIVSILFVISLIVLALGNSPLSIAKHQNGEFWISGCSSDFLARISG